MTPVEVLVFDIDDTLYLERDYVRSGFNAVGEWAASTLGVEGFAARCWKAFLDGARGDIFDYALKEFGLQLGRDSVLEMRDVYRKHGPSIRLAPDALAFLEVMFGVVGMAAITDGPVDSQRAKIRALDIDRWLDPIVLTEELGERYRKPSSLAFQSVQEAFGSEGNGCLYVADNPAKDFAGPAALGWRTCRIKRAGGLHERVPSDATIQEEISRLTDLQPAYWRDCD